MTGTELPEGTGSRGPGSGRCSRQELTPEISRSASFISDYRAREKHMTETLSTKDGTIAVGSENDGEHLRDRHSGAIADLRRVGINPNFWYPVAVSGSVRKKKTFAATFAGERIALYRGESGTVYALEDRCAHRQVPLSMGVVEGDTLRCLLSRVGLSRKRPHLANTVSAQGRRPPAARCPRLSGPRSLWPGIRLPRRCAEGGHDSATGVAGVRFRQAQDHDVLPYRPLPLLVHARESP